MKLRTYLKEKQITVATFTERLKARGLDVTEFGVRKWVTGERMPRRDSMPIIVEETEGQVTSADFYDPPPKSGTDDGSGDGANP